MPQQAFHCPASVIAAMEHTFHQTFAAHGRLAGRTLHQGAEVSWVMVDPAPWPSLIFGARFDPENVDADVGRIMELISQGRAPRKWFLGPSSRPADLGAHLERRGFLKSADSAAMAVDLSTMKTHFPWPAGLTISRVDSDQTLQDWTRVLVQVMFQGNETDVDQFFRLISSFDQSDGNPRFYLGSFRGRPVATSMCFLAGSLAGIYHVTTRPEYRNRGIGKHMTLTPLLDARDGACSMGSLFASQLGEAVYRQIGFEAYSRISVYRLPEVSPVRPARRGCSGHRSLVPGAVTRAGRWPRPHT